MYVCKYNEFSGSEIRRENLDFKVISDTISVKSDSATANNSAKPTKVIISCFYFIYIFEYSKTANI